MTSSEQAAAPVAAPAPRAPGGPSRAQRNVLLLLGAAILVILLGVWLASRHHADATLAGDVVLPGAEAALNKVTEVHLIRGDGSRTTLKPGSTGWTVGERDYAADTGKVRKLLLDIGSLNVVEEKTSLASNYPQLGVEDVTGNAKAGGTLVEMVTPSKTFSLIVGKSSSGKSGYVRVAGAKASVLAAPLITVDADPKRWLDPALVDVSMDRVKAVDVKPADGPAYTLSREKKEQQDFTVSNVPKGRELTSPAAADPIAGSLSGLTLDDAHKAAQSAPKVDQVVFHTFDGLDLTVSGHKDGPRTLISLAATGTGSAEAEAKTLADRVAGWDFEVASYKYEAIFKPLEDLLQKPPEKKTDAKKPALPKTSPLAPKAD